MFWNHLFCFVATTLLLGISLACFVRPTVRADLGGWSDSSIKLKPAKHKMRKLNIFAVMTLVVLIVWMFMGFQLATIF